MRKGFDALVGNPPFLGGTLIGGHIGLAYHDFLVASFAGTTGLADLVAFFLRQGFFIVREHGCVGLLATNTVSQGDTRASGLAWILQHGGHIYAARRRYAWPGEAAVLVSVVHFFKGDEPPTASLDGVPVDRVSAYLLRGRADHTPVALRANRGLAYVGSKPWGAGFLFEETPAGGSSSLADLARITAADPSSHEVIFSYLGGEEFNASPTQSPSRFVIDFGERTEEEARRWPLLFQIVEERVRPVRAGNKQRNYRENWWLHVTRVPEAAAYLRTHGRLIAFAKVSKHLAAAFVRGGTIISDRMLLVLDHTDGGFAVVQSRVHEAWARLVGTTMKDDLSYTTECFDTFPRPAQPPEEVGHEYYEFRAALMLKNNEGLTKTYNRFHDPDERSPDIFKLRELHAQMDRAVLDAYGWNDIQPAYDFRAQLDESVRLTWNDDTRDEVLARLLELNRVMAEKEAMEAPKKAATAKQVANKAGTKKKSKARSLALPGVEPEDT